MKLSAGVAELEALIVEHILPIFREYRTTMSDAYPTFKFWDMFVEAANLFLHNIRAEHEGDWKLHLHCVSSMLKYYGTADMVNYTRWSPDYLLDKLLLPRTASNAFEMVNL